MYRSASRTSAQYGSAQRYAGRFCVLPRHLTPSVGLPPRDNSHEKSSCCTADTPGRDIFSVLQKAHVKLIEEKRSVNRDNTITTQACSFVWFPGGIKNEKGKMMLYVRPIPLTAMCLQVQCPGVRVTVIDDREGRDMPLLRAEVGGLDMTHQMGPGMKR